MAFLGCHDHLSRIALLFPSITEVTQYFMLVQMLVHETRTEVL